MSKLTTKQQKFVDAYDGNAKQAAITAGYAIGSAEITGCKLLRNTKVVDAIQARQEKPRSRVIATREERQAFWTNVMYGNEKDIAYKDGEKIDVDVKMSDRLKATELLGKSEADFTENLSVTGVPTVIIKDLTGK